MSKRRESFPWLAVIGALLVGAAVTFAVYRSKPQQEAVAAAQAPAATTNFATMEVAQAVMVTVELDFGPKLPSIADALKDIERRSEPEDGRGRTFAILDGYGQPTAEGKLHISMHVSSEKPGKAALVFKRTGQVLWESKIIPSKTKTNTFTGKDLLILIAHEQGKVVTVDGSNNPATILDANIKEMGIPIRAFWPDGAEKEMTFIYSACGCPVKVMTRRVGERTERTSDTPVIFPDDPAAVTLISRIMGWN